MPGNLCGSRSYGLLQKHAVGLASVRKFRLATAPAKSESGGGAMKVEIPDGVRSKVTQCPHEFSCLETGRCGDRALCEIEYAYGGNVMRLASRDQVPCPYRVAFGHSQLCLCPVREYPHIQAQIHYS